MASKKDDYPRVEATKSIRVAASAIREARQNGKEWKRVEEDRKDKFTAETEDTRDVVYVTKTGEEVATVSETISSTYDYAAFFKDNPSLVPLLKAYKKPPTTTVKITTEWVETPGYDDGDSIN